MDRQIRACVTGHRCNAEELPGLCNRPAAERWPKLIEGQMAALKAVVLAPIRSGQNRAVGDRQSVPVSGGVPGALAIEIAMVARSVAPEDPTAPPAEHREGPTAFKRGPATRLTEIVEAHRPTRKPTRLKIRSQRCYGASGEGMAPSSL